MRPRAALWPAPLRAALFKHAGDHGVLSEATFLKQWRTIGPPAIHGENARLSRALAPKPTDRSFLVLVARYLCSQAHREVERPVRVAVVVGTLQMKPTEYGGFFHRVYADVKRTDAKVASTTRGRRVGRSCVYACDVCVRMRVGVRVSVRVWCVRCVRRRLVCVCSGACGACAAARARRRVACVCVWPRVRPCRVVCITTRRIRAHCRRARSHTALYILPRPAGFSLWVHQHRQARVYDAAADGSVELL